MQVRIQPRKGDLLAFVNCSDPDSFSGARSSEFFCLFVLFLTCKHTYASCVWLSHVPLFIFFVFVFRFHTCLLIHFLIVFLILSRFSFFWDKRSSALKNTAKPNYTASLLTCLLYTSDAADE